MAPDGADKNHHIPSSNESALTTVELVRVIAGPGSQARDATVLAVGATFVLARFGLLLRRA